MVNIYGYYNKAFVYMNIRLIDALDRDDNYTAVPQKCGFIVGSGLQHLAFPLK